MPTISINDLVNLNEPVQIKITDDLVLNLNVEVKTLFQVHEFLNNNDLTKDDNALDALNLIVSVDDFAEFTEQAPKLFTPNQITQILVAIWDYWLNYVTGNAVSEFKNSKKK